MSKILNLRSLEARFGFKTRIDTYIDGSGNESKMKWIPPFRACRALTSVGAPSTPSNTPGDFFHPSDIPTTAVLNTDYEVINMGGYWVDMYLCSSPDAASANMGTVADGVTVKAYVSQPGVSPRVLQTIDHFKTYLASRFGTGGFSGQRSAVGWAGKGGLMTDAHWFELWVWVRINRWLLRGNTSGYTANYPMCNWDSNEIGVPDLAHLAAYGLSTTGGGPASWELPVSDFSGNRWEFTDGLRMYNSVIYTAGKTINPPGEYNNAAYTNTGLLVAGISNGQSVASYRTEAAIKGHGIPASGTTAGTGPMDGQGFFGVVPGEVITMRGGDCSSGSMSSGEVNFNNPPTITGWNIGARAVLVP